MQELIVPVARRTIERMVTIEERQAFSDRLNTALDRIQFAPKGAGRQTLLGEMMGVSQKGARKWLEGESMPETTRMIELARLAKVRYEWLTTGRGEMYEGMLEDLGIPRPASTSDHITQAANIYDSETAIPALDAIRLVVDGQHRLRAIKDEDAAVLHAAIDAIDANMTPNIRASILLILNQEILNKRSRLASDRVMDKDSSDVNSSSGEEPRKEEPARLAPANPFKEAGNIQGGTKHEPRKRGTNDS